MNQTHNYRKYLRAGDTVIVKETITKSEPGRENVYYATHFHDYFIFNDFCFPKGTPFHLVNFLKGFRLQDGGIYDVADFSETNFDTFSRFLFVTFYPETYFNESHFWWEQSFNNCIFKQKAFFNRAIFDSSADFSYSTTFDSIASFYQAKFYSGLSFELSSLNHGADFSEAHLLKAIDFNNAFLGGKLSFNSITIDATSTFDFTNADLPDTIDFSNIKKIENTIDLSVATFKSPLRYDSARDEYRKGKWHYINFYRSDISKFKLDYYRFRLYFPGGLSSDEKKSIYQALLKNFDVLGQKDSYAQLDIEYHDYLFGFWNFLRWWNLYGYEKKWIFGWIFLLSMLFAVVTFFFLEELNGRGEGQSLNGYTGEIESHTVNESSAIYRIQNIPQTKSLSGLRSFTDIAQRFWYSMMYSCAIFFLLTIKIDNLNFKRAGVIYVLLVYSVGIICLGYLANFVLQK